MSLKNRLSTVEVSQLSYRNNSTISPPTSRPISEKLKHSGRPKTHSKKLSMPKMQISGAVSAPSSIESTKNCTCTYK